MQALTMSPESAPVKRSPGRPPGKTREKRSINLQPRIWQWFEAQAMPGESFSKTCNRVISDKIMGSSKKS